MQSISRKYGANPSKPADKIVGRWFLQKHKEAQSHSSGPYATLTYNAYVCKPRPTLSNLQPSLGLN